MAAARRRGAPLARPLLAGATPASKPARTQDAALRGAAIVFAVALALRLLHLWQVRRAPFFSLLMGDALAYDAWARQIAAGDWLGTDVFYQAPLYPYFLGLLYSLFGHELTAVRACQAAIGSASCALLVVAGSRLFGRREGLTAGLVLAVFGPAIFFDGLVQKTVLDGFLLCALLLLVVWLGERVTSGRAVAAGVVLGGLALTRENSLILVPLMLGWLWQRSGRTILPLLAMAAGTALVLAPVASRNAIVGGEFHLTTSQFGPNLYIGNSPDATGVYVPLRPNRASPEFERQDATELAEARLGRPLRPAEVSRYWQQRALEWIGGHPGRWAILMVKKLALVWNAGEISDTEDIGTYSEWSLPLRLGGVAFHFGVLAPLGLLGIWLTRARWKELWILYGATALYSLSVAVFFVFARYRYPLVPLLALFAGAGLVGVPAWWRRAGGRERALTAAATAVLVVACNWPVQSAVAMRGLTHYNIGARLQEEGRADEALEQYLAALSLLPEWASASAHANLGALLTAKGQHDAALRHLREAVRIDASMPEGHVNLGIGLAASGRPAEAVAAFRIALALDPRRASAHYDLGLALATLAQPVDAAREFGETIRLDPAHAEAHNNLGILLASEGRIAEGIGHFEEALRLKPDFREAQANLARAQALLRIAR